MKRIAILCILSSGLLHAAPVAEKKRKVVSLEDIKKISNQRNQQLLTDLTRITLGIGCLVASGIAFKNCYTAYKKCDENNSIASITKRVINDVDLKACAGYVAEQAKSYTHSAWEKTKSGTVSAVTQAKSYSSSAWEKTKSGAAYAGSSIWSGCVYAWNALPNPRKVKLFSAASPTRSSPTPSASQPDPAPVPQEPEPVRSVTPPPATPVAESLSPRLTRNSPVKSLLTQDLYVNYAKAVGWGTAGLISGIVGVRLIMKGLHIEFSKKQKVNKNDRDE